MSLMEIAAAGVRLDTLRALRDRLAGEIDTCESMRDVAALSLRLMDVLAQIADLEGEAGAPAAGSVSAVDEFTQKRRERGAS